MSITKIIEELRKFSQEIIELEPPVDSSLVEVFEQKHQLILPNDYKKLLTFSNGFSLMGIGVLGFSTNKSLYGLESVYQFEHYEVENPQPKHLVPFHNDGRGNHYCLDTNTINEFSCNIIFWQHDLNYSHTAPEIVNHSLADWIQEVVINWTLEDYNYDGSER
jgi:hypothetical protein